ncbi:unnamed protein product, partial [Brenthis ino]
MPEAWRLSYVVPIYKEKGSKYECNSYCGIKILSYEAVRENMEKAFDWVPMDTIRWRLRKRNVPEYYINIIAAMYRDARSMVRIVMGEAKPIAVTEGASRLSAKNLPVLFGSGLAH